MILSQRVSQLSNSPPPNLSLSNLFQNMEHWLIMYVKLAKMISIQIYLMFVVFICNCVSKSIYFLIPIFAYFPTFIPVIHRILESWDNLSIWFQSLIYHVSPDDWLIFTTGSDVVNISFFSQLFIKLVLLDYEIICKTSCS